MADKSHPRVPPLQYLPAGCLSSKQSSIETEDPVLEASSLMLESLGSRERSTLEGSNIIVFDKFTPKDGFQTDAVGKCFKFPEESNSRDSLKRLVVQLEGDGSIQDPGDSLQLSSRGTAVDCSRLLTSNFCSPSDLVLELKSQIDSLKANCIRYEAQNQELRHEIHLSTSDILLLDKSKREAVAEIQSLKTLLNAQNNDYQTMESLLIRLRKLLSPEDTQEGKGVSISNRCDMIVTDVEALLSKYNRLKSAYEQTVSEARGMEQTVTKLQQCEMVISDLQASIVKKDKVISILEDQMAVLRTAASKGSSGRNSSEIGKRGEMVKSASTSFQKTTPNFIHKRNVQAESPGFSSYLIEDEVGEGCDSSRADPALNDLAKRYAPLERSQPTSELTTKPTPLPRGHITSISPVPRGSRATEQRQSLRWTSVSGQTRAPKFISKGFERRLGESTGARKTLGIKQN